MRYFSASVACIAVVAAAWATDAPGRIGARLLPGNSWLQPTYAADAVAPDLSSAYQTQHASVVMLGDSLTYAGEWSELLPGVDVVNRGLAGDTVKGMLARVDTVTKLHPSRVFIMAGINDLQRNTPPAGVIGDYRKLVLALQASGAKVTIQSTLHVAHDRIWLGIQRFRNYRRNSSISELNDGLRQIASDTGAEFLDVNAVLAPQGELPPEATIDGVHLRASAYGTWAEVVSHSLTVGPRVAGRTIGG
jgi:lysophospholipase L1-like esterase